MPTFTATIVNPSGEDIASYPLATDQEHADDARRAAWRWLVESREAEEENGLPSLLGQGCRWYARCTNYADGWAAHPVLGPTPICARCAAKHDMVDGEKWWRTAPDGFSSTVDVLRALADPRGMAVPNGLDPTDSVTALDGYTYAVSWSE